MLSYLAPSDEERGPYGISPLFKASCSSLHQNSLLAHEPCTSLWPETELHSTMWLSSSTCGAAIRPTRMRRAPRAKVCVCVTKSINSPPFCLCLNQRINSLLCFVFFFCFCFFYRVGGAWSLLGDGGRRLSITWAADQNHFSLQRGSIGLSEEDLLRPAGRGRIMRRDSSFPSFCASVVVVGLFVCLRVMRPYTPLHPSLCVYVCCVCALLFLCALLL